MAQLFTLTLEQSPSPDLQSALAAYTKAGTGKALFRESDRIDSAARRRGVEPITSLLSESREALIAQMKEEGFDTAKMRLPTEQFFPAAQGLKTLRALIPHITANLNDFKQPNPILRDLKAAEELLQAAEKANVGFHFTRTVT